MPCPNGTSLSVRQYIYLLNQYSSTDFALAQGILNGLVSLTPNIPAIPEPPEFEIPPLITPDELVLGLLALPENDLSQVLSEVNNDFIKLLSKTPVSFKKQMVEAGLETQAMAKRKAIAVVRKKFGISIHANMDLRTIVDLWTARLADCPQIATECPLLAAAMAPAAAAIIAQDAVIQAQVIAKQAMDAAELAGRLVRSAIPGPTVDPGFIAAEATNLAAVIAQEAQTIIVNQLTDSTIALIENLPC